MTSDLLLLRVAIEIQLTRHSFSTFSPESSCSLQSLSVSYLPSCRTMFTFLSQDLNLSARCVFAINVVGAVVGAAQLVKSDCYHKLRSAGVSSAPQARAGPEPTLGREIEV